MAMKESEQKGARPAMNRFSTEEDPFPRNKAVVEDRIGIGVTRSESSLEVLPITQIMDGHHLLHSFPVCRNSKGHSPIFLLWQKSSRRNDQNLVGD